MPAKISTLIRVIWTRARMERTCGWSRARLEAHQAVETAAIRRFAMERSPFYARFHKGTEGRSLEELPILTKAAMMENFDDLVTDRAVRLLDAEEWLERSGDELFRDRYVVLSTSGSTGRRGVFLFDPGEWIDVLANITRPLSWAGYKPSLTRPARGAMIASRTPWHYSARVSASLANSRWPSLYMDAAEDVNSMVGRLNEWRPFVLSVYPSALRQLAEEQIAGRLKIEPRFVGTAGELLTDEMRARAMRAWGVPVRDTYGATEYAPIAAECEHGRKHLFEDGALIESVDEKGKPVPPGEAGDRVLITVFGRRTQPLIRYEISDVLRITAGGCECGRPYGVVDRIEGRVEDVLEFAPGVQVHPNVFHEVLETVPASGWQVVQSGSGIVVNLTGLADHALCENVRGRLDEKLRRLGAEVSTIEVRQAETLTRGPTGKAPLVTASLRGAGCV